MFDRRRPEQPDIDVMMMEFCTPSPDLADTECLGMTEEKQVWYQDDDYINPRSRASFIFRPSFLDSYWDLKSINPQYAEIYIEALMCFGVDRYNEVPDVPVIKMALRGPFITIDKAFTKYVLRRDEERKQEKREQDAKQTAKHIKDAISLMETKQIEWEKRIKKEWPYLYGK